MFEKGKAENSQLLMEVDLLTEKLSAEQNKLQEMTDRFTSTDDELKRVQSYTQADLNSLNQQVQALTAEVERLSHVEIPSLNDQISLLESTLEVKNGEYSSLIAEQADVDKRLFDSERRNNELEANSQYLQNELRQALQSLKSYDDGNHEKSEFISKLHDEISRLQSELADSQREIDTLSLVSSSIFLLYL